jgi:hypothetical protein
MTLPDMHVFSILPAVEPQHAFTTLLHPSQEECL